MIAFDTAVVDLTDELGDPVDVLFGIQLGGGTDIDQALGYCQTLVTHPAKTVLILITDLYEGGDQESMLRRAASLIRSGVRLIVLLALSDDGAPGYDHELAAQRRRARRARLRLHARPASRTCSPPRSRAATSSAWAADEGIHVGVDSPRHGGPSRRTSIRRAPASPPTGGKGRQRPLGWEASSNAQYAPAAAAAGEHRGAGRGGTTMTSNADFKRRVRERMARTGESLQRRPARSCSSASTLHVTNGDSTVATLAQLGIERAAVARRAPRGPGPARRPDAARGESMECRRGRVRASATRCSTATRGDSSCGSRPTSTTSSSSPRSWRRLARDRERLTLRQVGEHVGIAHFGGLGELDARAAATRSRRRS